jgi:hypothetical protein
MHGDRVGSLGWTCIDRQMPGYLSNIRGQGYMFSHSLQVIVRDVQSATGGLSG